MRLLKISTRDFIIIVNCKLLIVNCQLSIVNCQLHSIRDVFHYGSVEEAYLSRGV